MKDILQYKNVAASDVTIKDIDEKKGRITGYFAVFGNVDSDDEMIMPGAFKKTLSENYRRIKHLYQHDPWRPLSGTKDERLILKEDAIGLGFDSTISQTSWGRDTIRLYVDGVVDEQSVGIQTTRSNEKETYRELIECKCWEGSTVTWAANPLAQTTGVKGLFTVDSLTKKMDRILKSIRDGKYENEDIFDQLELYFKQLQQLFIELTTAPKQSSFTLPETKDDDLLDVFKTFNKTLNTANYGQQRIAGAA